MNLAVNSPEVHDASGGRGTRFPGAYCLHQAWRVSIVITIAMGIFHLVNLIGGSRAGFGPTLITFFRVSFTISWLLLVAEWVAIHRLPRLDRADAVVALLALVFVVRGAFTPETFVTTLNWIITGAGVFYLIRFGTRNARDVRLVLVAMVGAALVIAFSGLFEYAFKMNPLFDSIQIDVIGVDTRIAASDQFYRIRSLVGHPSFVGAILLGSMPLTLLVFWRRRWLLAGSMALLAAGLFLTFSRGSWIIGTLVLLPIIIFRARDWLRRNLKWVAPLAILPVAIVAFDYLNRDEVSAQFGKEVKEKGLHWIRGDGPVVKTSGEADGIQPYERFVYFDVGDDFYYGGNQGPVTLVIHYFDRGTGAISIEYDSTEADGGSDGGIYTPTTSINKTDSRTWTTAAFYIQDPRFGNRQNSAADFRIVDDDSSMTLGEVIVQKGRLKLPGVVAQQWQSRAASLSTRASLYPFAWEVLKENPLGVGLFNTPGTNNHAVDSLPLTWIMEFGWPGFLLILGLFLLVAWECRMAWKEPRAPAVVLLISIVVILLHGSHLMILYDKPSLVLTAAIAAIYANIRPWRRGGAVIGLSNRDCMF
jgi:hypothetical protein